MADNWYVVLELEFEPPMEDEDKIRERIEEKARFWSAHFNDFKMGAQYRAWHQNLPQIKKDMLGAANIRKKLAAEACTIVYEPVDKLLKTIGRKGNITADEGEKLAQKLNINLSIVKKRAAALGIPWKDGINEDFQAVYDKYYKARPQNVSMYDGMKQMLESFGVGNLYDFLYTGTPVRNANSLPCETLRARAAERKKKEFYKTDSVSSTGSKLCGQCEIVFKDDGSKEAYDTYLEYVRRRTILEDAKSIAEISSELTAEQGEEIIGQLTQVFRDRRLAEKVLAAFCRVEKILYQTGTSSDKPANIKICRCGCTNDVSDGRKICRNCGLELVIRCPECGAENDANIRVCKCGFKFENIDKAVALCEQAEYAMERLDFGAAKTHLSDAARYWPSSNRASSLEKRLLEVEKRLGTEMEEMREAVKNKRYCEGRKRYQNIRQQFPKYSEPAVEEEIDQAISKAKALCSQAKAARAAEVILDLCTRAYDVCADFPGIRELIPVPDSLTGFQVTANAAAGTNLISWIPVEDRSVRYVVVRSQEGWVQNVSDGKSIFRGSAASCTDKDIEPGIPYYYNVFAERAGVYSGGASGEFREIINLFEIRRVAVAAADSSLNITWDIPKNATAEIYEIQGNGAERHVASSETGSYLITGLKNDREYRYRVSLSYFVAGKRQETKGVHVSGIPDCPPLPIDTLRVKPLERGWFQAVWRKTAEEEVCLYGASERPAYRVGDVIALSELEQSMTLLQQQRLSPQAARDIKKEEAGISFRYEGSRTLYVAAVVVKGETAVFGNIARAGVGETAEIKSIRPVNGKINIFLEPPEDAAGFVVLYRFDQFPTDIGDIKTVRKYIPLKQYQINSAIVLDTLEEKKYYFTVYTEFRQDGEKEYSPGTEYLFDHSAKRMITYSVSVNKKLFGESSLSLEFEADCREFILPDIEIMSSTGKVPMFKASAQLLYTIPSQQVRGSVQVKIPIPKTLPKNTYIKAFIKDDSMQRINQLCLKQKSSYQIS